MLIERMPLPDPAGLPIPIHPFRDAALHEQPAAVAIEIETEVA
jgi:hypothetical protein